ncbi:MAG: phage tail tube protein [bacterium]
MSGIDGFGVKLQIHDGEDPGAFDDVGEVLSINPLDVEVEDIETTSHDSEDQWREFIGGLKDGGEVSADINFDPALHGDLLDIVGVTRDMKIVFPAAADDAEVEFSGHINGFTVDAPHDDKLEGSVSMKVSGKPELTIP